MTFGIDISGNQAGMNLKQAKAEGVEFVIVKAAGSNIKPMYVAGNYHQHVDAVHAAGIRGVGHYYVPGRGDVTQQADYFVEHLYRFDKFHDVLALDNEPLNTNATHWKQDDALKFLTRVKEKTGISWNRLWLYCPAGLTRDNGPWAKVTSRGIRIWWSAYGKNLNSHTPDHTPALEGKIARWDVHQFSSNVRIAGETVDANFSKLSLDELFGGKVTSTSKSTPKPVPVKVKPQPTPFVLELPDKSIQVRVQKALRALGLYTGPVNGFGINTFIAIQKALRLYAGYKGPIDGKIEDRGAFLIQTYAKQKGDYTGKIDKKPGHNSWTGFALALEREV